MTASGKTTEHLARLVSAKRQVLEIVVQLSERQIQLIEAGEIETLLKLLTAKQTVLAQMQAIEKELALFRNDDPDLRVWPSPEARAACQAQASETNALLQRSLELQKRAESLMIARRDAAEKSLWTFQAASDARTAYAPTMAQPLAGLHIEG